VEKEALASRAAGKESNSISMPLLMKLFYTCPLGLRIPGSCASSHETTSPHSSVEDLIQMHLAAHDDYLITQYTPKVSTNQATGEVTCSLERTTEQVPYMYVLVDGPIHPLIDQSNTASF
jgi:hypothetical protein